MESDLERGTEVEQKRDQKLVDEIEASEVESEDDTPQECSSKLHVPEIAVKQVKVKKEPLKINVNKKHPKNLTAIDLKKIEAKKKRRLRQIEKQKSIKMQKKLQKEQETVPPDQDVVNNSIVDNSVKSPSNFQKVPQTLRQKNKERQKVKINGNDVKITHYDGFAIKSEDAFKLKQLRQALTKKGLSQKEIKEALKHERRKAEKALIRAQRTCKVCGKTGHTINDCPQFHAQTLKKINKVRVELEDCDNPDFLSRL